MILLSTLELAYSTPKFPFGTFPSIWSRLARNIKLRQSNDSVLSMQFRLLTFIFRSFRPELDMIFPRFGIDQPNDDTPLFACIRKLEDFCSRLQQR